MVKFTQFCNFYRVLGNIIDFKIVVLRHLRLRIFLMASFINMRQFSAILWTYKLSYFDHLFSSNLQSRDELCTSHKYNYLSENVLCSKNDKIVTDIYLKSLGTKKGKKHITLMV